MGGQCDSSKQEYQASTHTRIHKSIYILSLIPHIFLLYAKINNSFTTFFPYSKISHSFTIFFPHSKLNHSFMIFSLPIPEQDSLSLPPVHYITHLILFYFKLFLFSDQPCLCLPFPKPTVHKAWHWHCPSKHCLPKPGELPQRRHFSHAQCCGIQHRTQHWKAQKETQVQLGQWSVYQQFLLNNQHKQLPARNPTSWWPSGGTSLHHGSI